MHFWGSSLWDKMCFEYQRIKIQWKKVGQHFCISLRSGKMGANPAPLTVSLTVKYPFFYDLPYPPRNLQTCCCPKMIEGISKMLEWILCYSRYSRYIIDEYLVNSAIAKNAELRTIVRRSSEVRVITVTFIISLIGTIWNAFEAFAFAYICKCCYSTISWERSRLSPIVQR